MSRSTEAFDVGRLGLSSGEASSIELDVPLEALEFGGQRYEVDPPEPRVRLDVAHTTSGYSFRLRSKAGLRGPCMRCLEPARHALQIDAREIDQPSGGDDLRSPYVEGDELDLRSWARDAVALALPAQIVCSEECPGLCAVCGENLNHAGRDHRHESAPDPRWAKLRELEIE